MSTLKGTFHIHNMYGLEMNIEYIISNIRKINKYIIIVLDLSQSAGHKMMAMQGIGIIYIYKVYKNIFCHLY